MRRYTWIDIRFWFWGHLALTYEGALGWLVPRLQRLSRALSWKAMEAAASISLRARRAREEAGCVYGCVLEEFHSERPCKTIDDVFAGLTWDDTIGAYTSRKEEP